MQPRVVRGASSQSGKTAILAILGVFVVAAAAGLAVVSGKVPGLGGAKTDAAQTEQVASVAGDQAAQAQPASGTEAATARAESGAAKAADASGQEQAALSGQGELSIRPGNPTVAKVGDAEVKRLDVLNLLQQLPPNLRQAPIQQIYPMLLEQVINGKIIDERAAKANLAEDAQVKEQLEMARQQIVRNVFLQREADKSVTEDKVKAAYEEFVKKQGDVEETKARHILVESEDKAKEVISKLGSGAKFEDLAKEYSSDNSKENGGDLGWFAKQEMVPAFAEAAFALKPGETSTAPVKSQFGFHVIKVEDRRMREKPKFDDVKPFLEAQIRREALESLVSGWRKDLKIEQFDINGDPIAPAAGTEGGAAPASAEEKKQ